jgi:hypothetical protein
MEIMAREKCGRMVGPHTVPVSCQVLSMFVLVWCYVLATHVMYSACNPKDNYDMRASFIVV